MSHEEMGYAGFDEVTCTHPEVRLGKHLLNKDLKPEQMYCLACGEAISE